MFLDELGGQVQPVASPFVPRREERLEDAIDECLGDARTIIHDIHDDPPPPILFDRAGAKHDMAGLVQPRQGLLGIAEKIEQHLHQPAGVDPNRGNIVVADDFHLRSYDFPDAAPSRNNWTDSLRTGGSSISCGCDELLRTVATRWSSRSWSN